MGGTAGALHRRAFGRSTGCGTGRPCGLWVIASNRSASAIDSSRHPRPLVVLNAQCALWLSVFPVLKLFPMVPKSATQTSERETASTQRTLRRHITKNTKQTRREPRALRINVIAGSLAAHLYVITAWPSTILMSPTSGGSRNFSRFSCDAINLSTAEFNTDCGKGIEPSIPPTGSNFI